MSARHNEGDVIKELVRMFKAKKIGDVYQCQVTLDDYDKVNKEQIALTQRWKVRFEYVCAKFNQSPNEVISLVK